MDDAFCDPTGTWAASGPASPIVPKGSFSGAKTGKFITKHYSAFTPINTGTLVYTDQFVQNTALNTGTAVTFYGSLVVPQGVTLKQIAMLVDPRAGGAITGVFGYNAFFVTVGTTVLSTLTSSAAAGVAAPLDATLTYVPGGGEFFFFKVTLNTGNGDGSRFYGVSLKYDSPNSMSTL
jgi:hypothetical protein